LELDIEEDGKPIKAEMADIVGRTSVPAIWIGGTFIGGCNDGPFGGINEMNNTGKLEAMLAEVGAL
jgi:glutaredoxin 3